MKIKKRTLRISTLRIVIIILLSTINPIFAQNKILSLQQDSIVSLVRKAYLYAMPLIYTDVTRLTYNIPDNTLLHNHSFPDDTFHNVVAPNNDTNYSISFLELNNEPVVITTPDTKGRYYVFPFLDGWTNNFSIIGKRTTGTHPQKYLITGPNWKGKVPIGLKKIKSPTNLVWIIGRIQVNSKKDQKEFVVPIQDQFKLITLSKWLKKDTSAVQPQYKRYGSYLIENTNKKVPEVVKNLSIEDFFNYFNALLKDNPPAAIDKEIIQEIASIGIKAGGHFSLNDFDANTRKALKLIPLNVYNDFAENKKWESTSGETAKAKEGNPRDYKTNYALRAQIAYSGLGALPPEEAIYYSYYNDSHKEPLDGQNNYIIHFDKGQLPPAQEFWSYTIYGKDRYLTANAIKRYAIGNRNKLNFNKDGSLTIYLSHKAPEKNKINNWLPIPDKVFNIVARIYVPTPEFLKNRSIWENPLPQKIDNK